MELTDRNVAFRKVFSGSVSTFRCRRVCVRREFDSHLGLQHSRGPNLLIDWKENEEFFSIKTLRVFFVAFTFPQGETSWSISHDMANLSWELPLVSIQWWLTQINFQSRFHRRLYFLLVEVSQRLEGNLSCVGQPKSLKYAPPLGCWGRQ